MAANSVGVTRGAETEGPRGGPLPVASLARTTAVDFESEVLPVLQRNCLACHNQSRAKGDLNLETPQAALKGGSSGPGLVPGKAAESLVFRAAAHQVEDMVMPPAGNKANAADLTPGELALLKAWIDQGAKGEVRSTVAVAWSAMPAGWSPSFAVAISADGRWIAGGRANRVEIYEVSTRQRVARLEDPVADGATHRDVVNALAFSPDGTWLASAGFREVKLWRQEGAESGVSVVQDARVPWTARQVARDGRSQAVGTAEGVIHWMDASGAALQTLHVGRGKVMGLAFSPDGRRIAAVVGSGELVVTDVASGVSLRTGVAADRVRGVLWLDTDRGVGVIAEGESRVRRWQVPPEWTVPGELESLPDREISGVALVAAGNAGEAGTHEYYVGADGSVSVFAAGESKPAQQHPAGPPTVTGAVSEDLRQVALAGADGVVRVWRLGDGAKAVAELSGDSESTLAVTRATQAEEFLKSEIVFQKGAVQRGEDEVKKAGEALAKATTKHAENEKALAGKQAEWKTQVEARTAAEKEKTELAAALKQATDAVTAAEARVTEAKATARDASESAASTRSAAELASRTRSDLSRLIAEFAEKAEAGAAEKVRALATAADGEAEQKRQAAEEATAKVLVQLDALAAAAQATGLAKAALERATAEIPPKQKAAEEKLASATKAAGDLENQVKKAEIAVSTSGGDVTLTRNQSEAAARELASAREIRERHEAALPVASAAREAAQAAATRHASSRVEHLIFSREGTALVTARASGRVQVWDLASGGLRDAWDSRDASVLGVTFVPSGEVRVATARGLERRSFAPRWTLTRTLGGEGAPVGQRFQDRVNALAFRNDGRALLTGGGEPTRGGELKLWSIPGGECLRDFGAVHSDAILALALSPDEEAALTGGADRFMRLIDLSSGKAVRQFEGHTHHVMGVAWLRDGRTVASAGAEAVVKLWNRRTGERVKNVDGFGKEVVAIQAVGVSPQFVAGSGAGQVRVFKTGGEAVRTLDAKGAFLHALAVTPDGRIAVAGDAAGVLHVWSVEDGKSLAAFAPER